MNNLTHEISGQALAQLRLVTDEDLVRDVADGAARRAKTLALRNTGMSWRTAKAAANDIKATDDMLRVVRALLGRGANTEVARRAAVTFWHE